MKSFIYILFDDKKRVSFLINKNLIYDDTFLIFYHRILLHRNAESFRKTKQEFQEFILIFSVTTEVVKRRYI